MGGHWAHDVFISYSSRDKPVADAICAKLEEAQLRCWIAPRDILPGATWAGSIAAAIETSWVFVLVFSRTSNNSEDVFRELSQAAKRGIPIVSFRIHGVAPSGRMDYYLAPTHWLDAVDPPLQARIQDLVETVGILQVRGPLPPGAGPAKSPVGERRAQEVPEPSPVETGRKRSSWHSWSTWKRWAIVGSGCVVLAAVAAALALLLGNPGDSPTQSSTTSPGATTASALSVTTTTVPPSSTTSAVTTTMTTASVEAANSWTNLEPTGSLPPPRQGYSIVYAPDTRQMILFGGFTAGGSMFFNDTWAYDPAANTWTELHPTGDLPSPRATSMVYVPGTGKISLLGGWAGTGVAANLSDTWAYDPVANTWTELHPEGDTPPSGNLGLAYDPRGKVVLFGGNGAAGQFLDDTWAYDPVASTWTELHPAGDLPSPRGTNLVYLAAESQVLFFGGYYWTTEMSFLNDTWVYDLGTNVWTELHPAGDLPSPRATSMVYDPTSAKAVIFGGLGSDSKYLDDTWTYDPAANTWTDLHPGGDVPSARVGCPMVYDPMSGKVILFGGFDGRVVLNDTWLYNGPN